MKTKLLLLLFLAVIALPACVADNGAEDATTEVSESHENELRKTWEKSLPIDSVYLATDKWYPMPLTDFPEKVTQKQLDSWKKKLLEIRHTDGFVIPTLFFETASEEMNLWEADLANYLHYVVRTGDSVDYKLIRYYANAFITGGEDIKNEGDRAMLLDFKLSKAANAYERVYYPLSSFTNNYAHSHECAYFMYQHILKECNYIDFYISKYRDSIRGRTVLQKEYNALKSHLSDIYNFEFSEKYEPNADLRYAFCRQINKYDYYENTLHDLAYVDYILNDFYSHVSNKTYDRISTQEINAALDQLKNDLIQNADTVYTEITLKDDLRFIEVYRLGLNKWLKSREKALSTLKGKEYDAFLKADNAVRYFCMMHIKNGFKHYNDSIDDQMREFIERLYTFNSPADSVRYGRNWYWKSIDLEKY